MKELKNQLGQKLGKISSFKKIKLVVIAAVVTPYLLFSFQNCQQSARFTALEESTQSSLATPPGPSEEELALLNCSFDDKPVVNGNFVTAYKASTVPFGLTCEEEIRTCIKGQLSGTYSYSTCEVGAPEACKIADKTVSHGDGIRLFSSPAVSFGQTCQEELRICTNGELSGSYNFTSCSVGAPSTCSFDGKIIAHNDTTLAFQNSTVPFGSECKKEIRKCTNGQLSGQFSFSQCEVTKAQSCMFDGKSVLHGESVTAYLNSAVAFAETCTSEKRVCNNGQLSGTYNNGSCTIGQPLSCKFNGKTLAHGEKVNAFLNSTELFGRSCSKEERVCSNGQLSGSYNFANCEVNAPKSCLFNGQTIAHGQNVKAHLTSTVEFNQECKTEDRVCHDGKLSGSYEFANCKPNAPKSCLFNGVTYAHNEKVIAYQSANVAFDSTCKDEQRVCNNGQLSGSFRFASCVKDAPASCLDNGTTIPHGQEVTRYKESNPAVNVKCEDQKRVCNNGQLSGQYTAKSCIESKEYSKFLSVETSRSVRPLDMIWVIDNSQSMDAETEQVRLNFNKFISQLDKNSDIKFQLISNPKTNPGKHKDGKTRNGIDLPQGLDPVRFTHTKIFVDSVRGPEHVTKNTTNYFRDSSKKIIVFVTDDNSQMSANNFMADMRSKILNMKDLSIYGFIGLGKTPSPCQFKTGEVYIDLATRQTKGKTYNVCDKDWSANFNDLQSDVISKVERTYAVNDPNVRKVTQVKVDGISLKSNEYSFSQGILTLGDNVKIKENSQIEIVYVK